MLEARVIYSTGLKPLVDLPQLFPNGPDQAQKRVYIGPKIGPQQAQLKYADPKIYLNLKRKKCVYRNFDFIFIFTKISHL